MWILQLINNRDIIEFDVEVLVDALEGAADGDVVFELDGHGGVDEGFEEAGGGEGTLACLLTERRQMGGDESVVGWAPEEGWRVKVEGKMVS